MNTFTKRYGLPACFAAAMHAALFVLVAPTPARSEFTPPIELPKPRPFPAGLLEILRPPPPEPNNAMTGVKPLGGGPSAPTLPHLPIERPDAPIQLPQPPEIPTEKWEQLHNLPKNPAWPGGGDGPGEWGGPALPPMTNATHLDRAPRALAQPAPIYPYALRQNGTTGEVIVEFDVDTTGRVITARIVRGGEREFEEAAVQAVLQWRFEPGRKNGRVVPFRMAVPMNFTIDAE